MLPCLVPVLFAFYLQGVLKFKCKIPGLKVNAQFLYFSTICRLHYDPQHVSRSTLLILRRTNYITTASGIVTLEIGERSYINKMRSVVCTDFQGDNTRGCGDTICPLEDEQRAARNMLRIVV